MWAPGSGSGDKTTMRLLIIKIFIPAASIYSVNSGIAKKDNVGLAYAIMNGGNLSLDKSQVLEVYYRLVLNDYLAISADVLYLQDDLKDAKNPSG